VVTGAAYCTGAAYAVVIGAAYVICGAAYDVVIGAAYVICGAARGMRAGSKGATSTSGSAAGAGAGAAFFFLVALFLDFLEEAAATPMQQSNKPIKRTHAMIGMQNPAEPEAVEPRLAWEPDESPEVKELKESDEPPIDANDAEESPLEPDDESLHGATVVGAAVGATVNFALNSGVVAKTSGSGVVLAKAPAMPPATTAAPAAAPTPMPIFCGSVKPSFFSTTTCGAQGSTAGAAAAKPTSKLNNTAVRAIKKRLPFVRENTIRMPR